MVGNFISTLHSSQMQTCDRDFSAAQRYEASAIQTIDKETALNDLHQNHVVDSWNMGLAKIKQSIPMHLEVYCQEELQKTQQGLHDNQEKANISDYIYEKATTGGLERLYEGPIDM